MSLKQWLLGWFALFYRLWVSFCLKMRCVFELHRLLFRFCFSNPLSFLYISSSWFFVWLCYLPFMSYSCFCIFSSVSPVVLTLVSFNSVKFICLSAGKTSCFILIFQHLVCCLQFCLPSPCHVSLILLTCVLFCPTVSSLPLVFIAFSLWVNPPSLAA